MFNRQLHVWRLRKLSDIRRMDITTLHARIGAKSGPYTANRVVSLLSAMFAKAIEWGWEGENPATRVKAFKEKRRERFLQPEELPAFFEALSKEANETLRDYFLLALFTGARRANVEAMRWEEINWHSDTWRIPDTKSGEAVTLALPPQAMVILKKRLAETKSQWVFPGDGKTGHLVEPKTGWKRILTRANIKNLRIHDLRRTLGSWQAAQGTSLQIIGKSLGHKSLQATQVYAHLNLDPVRASVNNATDALFKNAPAGLLGDSNG
jgi:integrase